ncbi:hypothetical protein HY251_06885 [bacterium]|nr:hypothetical protein [bacterium]
MKRLVLVLATLTLAGCPARDESKNKEIPLPPLPPASSFPDDLRSLVLGEKPGGIREVLDVKANARSGDEVVVRGWVQEFVKDRGLFTLVDVSFKRCGPTDCNTPWDYCCAPRADLVKHMLTVKIVGPDRQVLARDVRGLGGADYVKLVVVGELQRDEAGNVTVTAKGFCRDDAGTP